MVVNPEVVVSREEPSKPRVQSADVRIQRAMIDTHELWAGVPQGTCNPGVMVALEGKFIVTPLYWRREWGAGYDGL